MIAVSKTKSKTSMWQFVFREEALAQWVVLALGVATAALAGRRGGRPAVVGVFCAVWAVLFSLALVRSRHLFGLNSIGSLLSVELPMATLAACVTMIPVLWTAGKAPVLRAAAFGIAAATIVTFVFFPLLLVSAALYIPAGHQPCFLPSLESSIPSRTIRGIPTKGFFTNSCPTPIARELEFDRDYGTVRMSFWAHHRLLISGQTPDGDSLLVGVNRIDRTDRTQVSPHPNDSKVVTFSQTFGLRPPDPILPAYTEEFSVTVFQADGESLEEISLRYVPQACTCAYYDSP